MFQFYPPKTKFEKKDYVNIEIRKRGKTASSNQVEYHLEEQEKNETQEPVAAEKVTVKYSVDVISVGEVVEYAVVTEKHPRALKSKMPINDRNKVNKGWEKFGYNIPNNSR